MDGSTLTGVLDRMETNGFIVRRKDPTDRRSIQIVLTAKSYELKPSMIIIAQELDRKFRDKIPNNEFELLLKLLDEL